MKLKKIGVLFCVIAGLIICVRLCNMAHDKYYENPVYAELQQIINQEIGDEFTVIDSYQKNKKIRHISIEANHSVYNDESVLSKIDEIQKLVHWYALTHRQYFDYCFTEYDSEGTSKSEFLLCFTKSQVCCGPATIFVFYDKKQWKNSKVNGFSYLEDYSENADEGPYKISDMSAFKNVCELNFGEMVVDEVDFLENMPNLKKITINDKAEGYERLQKKAEELGIECVVY